MTGLVAGFAASSSYSSFAEAARYSSPFRGVSHSSSTVSQESSFSFDAVIAEGHSSPVVSLPFAEGEKSSDAMMDLLKEKLEGFLEPFGKKGEELAGILNKAMESLSDLVTDTSVDAASLSVDIRFARVEETYSHRGFGSSGSGVFSSFALEVSVSTATVDYDPGRAAVINTAGSKIEFTSSQMIEGHRYGVFRRQAPGIHQLPGFSQEKADETKEIIDFLKDSRRRIQAFSREEEHSFRFQLKSMFTEYNRYSMRA
ncbi:MAG: hypothetical protein ABJN40_15495 [Sneathiella sp.]